MAILDVFECSILVDGEALKECEDDEPDQTSTPKSVSKYVAAVAESHFSVECKVNPKFRFGKADHLSFQISLDGVDRLGVVMSKHSYSTVDGLSNCKTGVTWKNDEAYTVQKFRFAKVAIMDPDARHQGGRLVGDRHQLGNITVNVWPKKKTRSGRAACPSYTVRNSNQPHSSRDQGLVRHQEPEHQAGSSKMMKGSAVDLAAKLDKPEPGKSVSIVSGQKIGQEPLASFTFKYRSSEALKKLHVIPRTPSPVPLEARPRESLTNEDLRELLSRREAEAEASRVRIKKERAEHNLYTLRAVKRFRDDMGVEDNEVEAIASRPAKQRRPNAEIEVVDLSD